MQPEPFGAGAAGAVWAEAVPAKLATTIRQIGIRVFMSGARVAAVRSGPDITLPAGGQGRICIKAG